jgi:hypothetical protein
MRIRTQDLLSIRDGEPVDARLQARVSADATAQRELERLAMVRAQLRALPSLEPPPHAWAAIEARLDLGRPAQRPARGRWLVAACAVVVGAAVALWLTLPGGSAGPGRADGPRIAAAVDATQVRAPTAAELDQLLRESARLDRLLFEMPPRRGPIRADTAITIAGLEDQIAWIDAALSADAGTGADGGYRETLWRERVEMMNALVDVRLLQATAF